METAHRQPKSWTSVFAPLALTLLAPISLNILLFHIVLAPSLGLPLAILAAQIFLAYAYRKSFAPMLRSQAEPVPAPEHFRVTKGDAVSAQ